jgi:hypothetical protein
MLTIRDLSKEVDMTAVRGGNGRGWPSCGDEDSRERFGSDDRHHGDLDGRDRHRCERSDDASTPSFASIGINLSSCGW